MRRLVLLRHAKSSWDDDALSDHDRPLAPRGLRDAPRMGRRLAAHGIAPDLLLTSSAERARQTTSLIEPTFKLRDLPTKVDPQIYLASPGELLAIVAAIDARFRVVVLVGHNPGMTLLANMLLPDLRLSNLPTAGAVGIDCELKDWSGIGTGRFTLSFYDYPKNPDAAD